MITRLTPGTDVIWNDELYQLEQIKSLDHAIIVNEERNFELVKLSELIPLRKKQLKAISHSARVGSKADWDKAMRRLEIIQPLLGKPNRTFEDVKSIAAESGKGPATIYRWLRKFEETGVTTSLIRDKRSDEGAIRLDQEVEEIIQINIQNYYLKPERKSVVTIHDYVKADCHEAGVTPPSITTVHNRIKKYSDKSILKSRYSSRDASEKYTATPGYFPHDNTPYSVVQIDHTPMDVIIVDDDHRLPIGRPYLTIAIDLATKMIGGFVLDLHPPGALTAGLCISHAMMQKDSWLSLRGLNYNWPTYGKIQTIHVDNAKEFTGTMIERGCKQHNTELENRLKGTPRYGGHVERGFRTFMTKTGELPGTTHGRVSRKLDYDSEGNACFTLKELETWFATYLLGKYHNAPHSGQKNQPPIKRFEQLILGDKEHLGVGAPIPVDDEETMILDFTPYFERTIQPTGIVLDFIEYYSPALDPWIHAADPENPEKKRKFVFVRDPRDISEIYFFDPDIKEYFPVPYRDTTLTPISLWEYKNARNELKNSEFMQVDQHTIMETVVSMRLQEAEAVEKTAKLKKARAAEKAKRRNAQKRKNDAVNLSQRTKGGQIEPDLLMSDDGLEDDVKPFDVDG